MKALRKALLLGGLLLTLACVCISACCAPTVSKTEIRAQTRRQYNKWKDGYAEPGINLVLPQEPVVGQSVLIQASSQAETNITIWLDGQSIATKEEQIAEQIAVQDGKHHVIARAEWCFPVPDDYKAVATDYSHCLSSITEGDVIVDTTPPVISKLKASLEQGQVVEVTGYVQDATTQVSYVAIQGHRIGLSEGEFRIQIPVSELVSLQTIHSVMAVDVLGNKTPIQSVSVSFPPNRWEKWDSFDDLVDVAVDPGFSPGGGWVKTSEFEWRRYVGGTLQPFPPNRWEKTSQSSGLIAVNISPGFHPDDGGLLGLGRGVEWQQFQDGVPKPALYTPNDWYLLLWGVVSSPFWGAVLLALASQWLVRKAVKRFCTVLNQVSDLGEKALAERQSPEIPEPVKQLLEGFVQDNPGVAAALLTYLETQQQHLLPRKEAE